MAKYHPGYEDFVDLPLRLQATPKPGFIFTGWQGDAPSGSEDEAYLELSLNTPSAVTATFAPSTLTLAISEIFYNPPGTAEDAEFIELTNYGSAEIDLSGVTFSQGLSYTFPTSTTLAPGATMVLRPGSDYLGNLDNDGETLTLTDASGAILESFTYNDASPWPKAADNLGHSLVRISPGNDDPNQASAWRLSSTTGGKPGTSDSLPLTDNSTAGLLNYAFGIKGPRLRIIENPNNTADITFQRVVNADGVDLVLETSPNIEQNSWVPVPRNLIFSEKTPQNDQETLEIKSITLDQTRFYRIQVRPR